MGKAAFMRLMGPRRRRGARQPPHAEASDGGGGDVIIKGGTSISSDETAVAVGTSLDRTDSKAFPKEEAKWRGVSFAIPPNGKGAAAGGGGDGDGANRQPSRPRFQSVSCLSVGSTNTFSTAPAGPAWPPSPAAPPSLYSSAGGGGGGGQAQSFVSLLVRGDALTESARWLARKCEVLQRDVPRPLQRLASGLQRSVSTLSNNIEELEEDVGYWSTLLQGFAVLPFFMLVAVMCTNSALGFLITTAVDMGKIEAWGDWLRLPVTLLGGLITLRNVFVSVYELTMDSVRAPPLVHATLFRRLNELLDSWRRGLFFLTVVVHMTFSLLFFHMCGLGVWFGPVPPFVLRGRWAFPFNTAIKLALFVLHRHWTRRLAVRRRQLRDGRTPRPFPAAGAGSTADEVLALEREEALCETARRPIAFYLGYSDMLVLVGLTAVYYWSGAHADAAKEARVVVFNLMAVALTNAVATGTLLHGDLRERHALILNRDLWNHQHRVAGSRALLLCLLLAAVSARRHGALPAVFTFLSVYCSLNLHLAVIWACVELFRSLAALRSTLRRHQHHARALLGAYAALFLLYCALTDGFAIGSAIDDYLFLLGSLAIYWALRVQRRSHPVDALFLALVVFCVGLAVHAATYSLYQDGINELFQVEKTDTHLNISSPGIGGISLELAPAPITDRKAPRAAVFGGGGYPFCDLTFFGLNLIDFVGLSFLPYFSPASDAFATLFDSWFDRREWRVAHTSENRHAGAVFIDLYNRRLDLSVVSVRGTNPKNIYDVFQDAIMYNSALSWKITSALVPILGTLPSHLVANFLYLSYLPLKVSFGSLLVFQDQQLHYHDELLAYVQERIAQGATRVVLTGHSLGGGVAKVVAAKAGVPVFAVSSPGVYLSHKLFDIADPRAIDRFEINLLNQVDLVPTVDQLKGLVMNMECPLDNPLECHFAATTLCDLHNRCGAQFPPGAGIGARIAACNYF